MEVETRDDPWDRRRSATRATPLGALASGAPAPALASLERVALVVVIGACVVMQGFTATRGAVNMAARITPPSSASVVGTTSSTPSAPSAIGSRAPTSTRSTASTARSHVADIGYIFVLGYFASATVGTYVASLRATFTVIGVW